MLRGRKRDDAGRSPGDDVDCDAQLACSALEHAADVVGGTEPQPVAMSNTGGQGLSNEPPGAPKARRDGGGLVEQWPRVEDRKYLGVRPAHDAKVIAGQVGEQLGQLAARRVVHTLQQAPVPARG